jgi:hypothetical protein
MIARSFIDREVKRPSGIHVIQIRGYHSSSYRIAYDASEGIIAINADATGKTVLAKVPRAVLFSKDELFWKIVWSPDGNRLFFGAIVSENRRDNLYLLDVKSGRREPIICAQSGVRSR